MRGTGQRVLRYYNTVLVDLHSEEGKKISGLFKETLTEAKIHSIERVQNLVSYTKYQTNKELLMNKYDKTFEIEQYLFHGTSQTNPKDLIEWEEGFDLKYSREGMWGRGMYFAKKASYSDYYAYHSHHKSFTKQMFLAKVLVGNSILLPSNSKLSIPPINEETKERYDSIKGETNNWDVYIVYDNGRSYPEYLINYCTESKVDHHSSLPVTSYTPVSSYSSYSSATSYSYSNYYGGYNKKKKKKKYYSNKNYYSYNNYSSNNYSNGYSKRGYYSNQYKKPWYKKGYKKYYY